MTPNTRIKKPTLLHTQPNFSPLVNFELNPWIYRHTLQGRPPLLAKLHTTHTHKNKPLLFSMGLNLGFWRVSPLQTTSARTTKEICEDRDNAFNV